MLVEALVIANVLQLVKEPVQLCVRMDVLPIVEHLVAMIVRKVAREIAQIVVEGTVAVM